MRLEAAIKGNLHKFMEQQKEAAEEAVTKGVSEVTNRIKNELRQQVTSAGLGNKVAKSWQSKVYPKGKTSIEAAGWIYSKAPKIIRAFNDGDIIKSKFGKFLAIPTPSAPKRGVGGKRINPSNFPEHSLGKLRFVYRRGSVSLLVLDNLKASNGRKNNINGGGFRKATESALKTGRGLATAVMFFLVPQVQLKKRLDYQSVVLRERGNLPQAILENWKEVESNDEQA